MLLFLDIDGVVHPVFPRADLPDAENQPFSYLPRLEAVLREFRTVGIVIASDWRKHHSLAELRRMFSEDLRFRIVGVIGIDDMDHALGNRQRLVERYLAEHNLVSATWVAIDDDDGNYLPGAPLVLCNDGFCDEEERALRATLARACVLAAATDLRSDRDIAIRWFHEQRLEVFGGKTAEELVREGRVEDVLAYIEMLDVGFVG